MTEKNKKLVCEFLSSFSIFVILKQFCARHRSLSYYLKSSHHVYVFLPLPIHQFYPCLHPPVPEENIANANHGAMVIKGEMRPFLLDGDTANYDLDRGFTRHPIEESTSTSTAEGIVIRLGKPSIVNTIKLLLWDRDMR